MRIVVFLLERSSVMVSLQQGVMCTFLLFPFVLSLKKKIFCNANPLEKIKLYYKMQCGLKFDTCVICINLNLKLLDIFVAHVICRVWLVSRLIWNYTSNLYYAYMDVDSHSTHILYIWYWSIPWGFSCSEHLCSYIRSFAAFISQ